MSRIRTRTILAVVFLLAGLYFIKDGNSEFRRPQSKDKIAKLKASVEKLTSDVKTLQAKIETVPGFEKYDNEQIGFLEEHLKVVEDIYSKIKLRFKVGTTPRYDEAEARFEFHRAKAKLAEGKGNLALSQKEYEAALKAAEDHAEALNAVFDSLPLHAMSILPRVGRAHSIVLEAKLSLSRIKKIIQQKQK